MAFESNNGKGMDMTPYTFCRNLMLAAATVWAATVAWAAADVGGEATLAARMPEIVEKAAAHYRALDAAAMGGQASEAPALPNGPTLRAVVLQLLQTPSFCSQYGVRWC